MSTQVGPDAFGRSVMQTVSGQNATYQVYSDDTNTLLLFTMNFPNLNLMSAMNTINAMMSGSPPPPPDPVAVDFTSITESSPPTPARQLNVPFQPSSEYSSMVYYSVQISCSSSLGSGQAGSVQLLCDASPNPTTVRGTIYNATTVSIALTTVNTQISVLSYLVPIGHYVNLVTSGNAVFTMTAQSEEIIIQ